MTVVCLRRAEIATKRDYINILEKGKEYKGEKVIVDPPPSDNELSEDPCAIPIRLGNHWIRLMAKERKIEVGKKLRIEPFESVLVISMEYIALPKDMMAIILPRARVIQRGLLIHTTRVHPTWHGKLAFVIINLSRRPIEIETGAQIASMVVLKAEKGGTLPSREDLGRVSLDVDLERLAEKPEKPKDAIIELEEAIKDIEELAERYGPPFNTIADGIKKRFEELYNVVKKVLEEKSEETYKKLQNKIENEIDKKVKSEVEKEVNSRIPPIVNAWMSAIVVLVLTLAITLIQLTQVMPKTSDIMAQSLGAMLKTNNTMTNLNVTNTSNSDQLIDQINLVITKIVLPLAMVINLTILICIFLRILRGIWKMSVKTPEMNVAKGLRY